MEQVNQYLANLYQLSPYMREFLALGLILLTAGVVFGIGMTIGGLITYLERRVAARVQSRIGPNRVGPLGLLQWMADGIKLIMKEDVIPANADKILFTIAPYLVVTGVFASLVTLPFSESLIAADLNMGLVFLLAITSLVTVGILMSGWASNNKWSLLGGIRSAAQIVSYEVPLTLAVGSIIMLSGTLSLQGIIRAQGGWPWEWYIFYNPANFMLFFVYFTAALAEGNRTPFDLPEAESELVAGYNTEYSGMRFAAFFLGEFANVYLMSAIATVLFFGGWQIPGIAADAQKSSFLLQSLGLIIFIAKATLGVLLVIMLRWTLPRLRVDQLMTLCYRYLIPMAFAGLFFNALYMLLIPETSSVHQAIRIITTAGCSLFAILFIRRVRTHIHQVGDKIDMDLLARGEKLQTHPELYARRYGSHKKVKPTEAP